MKPGGVVVVFPDAATMAEHAAREWERISAEAIGQRGLFSVALSGGHTPIPFYRRLASCSCRWDKTVVFLADERFVPDRDADSNIRMIRENLLVETDIPPSNVHPVLTDLPDPYSAAKEYEKDLTAFFGAAAGEVPAFDLIFLGLGADGHTASLFPGTDALEENERLVVAVSPGGGKHDRITLTFPIINRARNVIFLVTGREKAETLFGVAEESYAAYPASRVRPRTGGLVFLADGEAASLLSPQTVRFESK